MSHLPKVIRLSVTWNQKSPDHCTFPGPTTIPGVHLSYQVLATGHWSRNGDVAKCWPSTTWKDRQQHCTKDISFSMFLSKGEFCFSWDSNHKIILPAQRNRLWLSPLSQLCRKQIQSKSPILENQRQRDREAGAGTLTSEQRIQTSLASDQRESRSCCSFQVWPSLWSPSGHFCFFLFIRSEALDLVSTREEEN